MTTPKGDFCCTFCGHGEAARHFTAEEMYFGTRDSFVYNECGSCRSLNIETIPDNLAQYYGAGYGGHHGNSTFSTTTSGTLRQTYRNLRTDARLGRWGSIARRIFQRPLNQAAAYPWKWLTIAGVSRQSSILDIGCGAGGLLRDLHVNGFKNLHGIDKFLDRSVELPGLTIQCQDVLELTGQFDFVMMHHSLEHVPNPLAALRHAASILTPNGVLMVRIPLADCEAQRRFGTNWYQLDAPRHLYIPSLLGMGAIAKQAKLGLFAVDFDATPAQFFVSQGYSMGMTMVQQRTHQYSHVSPAQLREFESLTDTANLLHTGDQAGFFFRALTVDDTPVID